MSKQQFTVPIDDGQVGEFGRVECTDQTISRGQDYWTS